jgi:hypothetical protein
MVITLAIRHFRKLSAALRKLGMIIVILRIVDGKHG